MSARVNCACCGRARGDGRRDRGWRYSRPTATYEREVRIAFCPTCWRDLVAAASPSEVSHG